MRRLTTEQFIEKARDTHGSKYDYSRAEYVNRRTRVRIICPDHGEFTQRAGDHMYKSGCPVCKAEKNSETLRLSQDEFLIKCRETHGDKYDYSEARYTKNSARVQIKCPEHGGFMQTPISHLQGRGCPNCYSYTGRTIVYLVHIKSHGEDMLKIGITNHEVGQRFADHRHPDQHATEIATLEFKERSDAKTIEAYLHAKHKKHQFTPEVKFGGHTECFNIEALDTIKQDFGV